MHETVAEMPRKKTIAESLMTVEEYAQKEWLDFYTYTLEKDGKIVRYLGVAHSRTPGDEIFSEIKAQLNEFSPDVVFIEGISQLRTEDRDRIIEWINSHDEEQVVRDAGESGLTAKAALDKGISVDCPEPKFKDELRGVGRWGIWQR